MNSKERIKEAENLLKKADSVSSRYPDVHERIEQLKQIIQAKRWEIEGSVKDLEKAVKCLNKAQTIHYKHFVEKWRRKLVESGVDSNVGVQKMDKAPGLREESELVHQDKERGSKKKKKVRPGKKSKVGDTSRKRRRLIPTKQISAVGEVRQISGKRSSKWGYVESGSQGHFVIAPQWEKAGKFSEGLAAVKRRGRYGYINEEGEVVIEYRFAEAGEFKNKRAKVKRYRRKFYINIRGEECLDQTD